MINIAIDGTSGAGKSSVAKVISQKLGFLHLNTGEFYRAMAYKSVNEGIDYLDENAINKMLDDTDLDVKFENNEQITMLNGVSVKGKLHNEKISKISSYISQYPKVRSHIKQLQRDIANKYNVVIEGRDIGTEILPDADYKFFITASPQARAKRRYLQLVEDGQKADFDEVLKEIIIRDETDTNREICPLRKADDAIMLDTSDMSFLEVVDTVMGYIK